MKILEFIMLGIMFLPVAFIVLMFIEELLESW